MSIKFTSEQKIFTRTPFAGYFYISFTLNTLTILAILAVKNYLPPVVPLFYGVATGTDQLTSTLGLLIAPLASIVITSINLLLCQRVEDHFLKRILAASAILISFLTTITILKIIFLVGFF